MLGADAATLPDTFFEGLARTKNADAGVGGREPSLLREGHVEVDPASGGPVVDQYGRCSDLAYYAAGNLLRPVESARLDA